MLFNNMLLIARTDAESGKLISSTVDILDHEYIKCVHFILYARWSCETDSVLRGTTVPGKGLAEVIQEAELRGATAAEIDKVEKDWLVEHPLCTFNQGDC